MEDETKYSKVRPLKKRTTGKTSNTKNAICFSSGLRFLWSWACFEDTHKHYKIMHIHIIVHHVRRKAQVKGLTSLREDEPVKPQISKTQEAMHIKPVFDELELGM